MAEIFKLRKTVGVLDGHAEVADAITIGKRSIEQAQRLIASRLNELVAALDHELARIAQLLDIVHDPVLRNELTTQYLALSTAVAEAKRKIKSCEDGILN